MTWSQGYPVSGMHRPLYHPSTGPVFAEHALRHAGYDPGPLQRCAELGFGQGLGLAIHAACSGSWWGVDFMPGQVARASVLAPGAVLSDEGFDEWCGRRDLPSFDFIAIQGVWSWISAANRQAVLGFIRRCLRPGGVVLVSYNTAVGWASLLPLRHALQQVVSRLIPPGAGPARAAELALPVLQSLFDAGSVYARANPLAAEILQRMHGTPGQMLVHEFLGAHWTPFEFAQVAEEMGLAKLTFAAQANRLTEAPRLYFTPDQQAILQEIEDPVFRQTVEGVMTGERYRRDFWVKGAARLSAIEARIAVDRLRYVLVAPPGEVALAPDLPQGQVPVPVSLVQPVLDALAGHAPRSFAEIAAAAEAAGLDRAGVRDALMLLWDAGAVQPAQGDLPARTAVPACAELNARIIGSSPFEAFGHLANPTTGSGLPVSRLQQLFLYAERDGITEPEAQAEAVGRLVGRSPEVEAARRFAGGLREIMRQHHVA